MILWSFCIPKVVKKCHKNFENGYINKNLTAKNYLYLVFYMCTTNTFKILKFSILTNLATLYKHFGPKCIFIFWH